MGKEWTPTPEQQEVIDLDSGQHLVLAPPGTGKTEILALRLLKAIESGIEQEKIACLTFTNRAAKQMIDRAKEKKIGENKAFIGNIHSFCSKFLRKHDIIPQISSLLDEEDTIELIRDLMSELVKEGHLEYNSLEVMEVDLSEDQIKAYRIIDNKTQEYAKWTDDLFIEIRSLDNIDIMKNFFNTDIVKDINKSTGVDFKDVTLEEINKTENQKPLENP